MRVSKRTVVLVVALCAIMVAAGGYLYAARPVAKLRTSVTAAPFNGPVPDQLPPVNLGPMTITPNPDRATSVLQFDDGTCESGLGVGATCSSVVNFDVPAQCVQAGLSVVGFTTKINSGTANNFLMFQAGTAPGAGRVSLPLSSPITGSGPCPTNQGFVTRAIAPGAAVVNGTLNFFAGAYGNMFVGRDTGPSAGRIPGVAHARRACRCR